MLPFMNFRPFPPVLCVLAVASLALSAPVVVSAQTAKKNNPTSKLFVADLAGESQIDTGVKIEPLVKNAVHAPEGAIIETKANSTDSLVLSNGTALYVTPDTRFEVKRFVQEPFSPNRSDLDVEPSISQTVIRLVRGGVGVCTSKLVSGSSMVYQTPHATVNVRGRRMVIQANDTETRISLIEGDATVIGDGSSTGQPLAPGQQAVVRRESPDAPAVVTIQPIPADTATALDETVSLACISRRTVYFEAVDRTEGGATTTDLVPVRTVPATAPTQFTVSPARING